MSTEQKYSPMSSSTKKISIILTALILLPAAFFTVYELNNLSENEKMLAGIYNRQVEAILFSVNQYSEDLTSSWAGRIGSMISGSTVTSNRQEIKEFLRENRAIDYFFTLDTLNSEEAVYYTGEETPAGGADVFSLINKYGERVQRLYSYYKDGYRKIEPIGDSLNPETSYLLFLTGKAGSDVNLCVIALNPVEFITQNLSPRIQQISREDFNISVFSSNRVFNFNRSDENTGGAPQVQKQIWLLPSYYLGISMPGGSIADIAAQRTQTNMILISALTLFLLAGLYFVIRSIKKEVELAQIKADFVSNVSHELRTPLALITMFAETLEMGRVKSDAKLKEYYSIISQESSRLSRIVNKILNFSKMEAGRRTYNITEINLNNTVESVLKTYTFHLHSKGFKYGTHTDDNLPLINADAEAVSEAFINLIDNAVKYSTGDKKEIEIRTGRENSYVFLEVKDYGIGIAPEDQKRIFEKFFRVSTGLVHNVKGTGLGLALVDHIMKAHNGKITLKSKPGEGSSFRLNFPVST